MPIGMQQWRIQIGVLEAQRHRYLSRATRKAARRRARGCRLGRINPGKANYGRMVVGITLLGLVVSLSLLLLKAGDVERNPGPLPDELLSQVDDSELNESDIYSVYQEVVSLAGRWRSMCFALRLQEPDASTIAASYPNNPEECLREMLVKWLKKGYEFWKYGSPSWRNMVQAIAEPAGGNNYALAQNIATRHQAQAVAFMRQPSIQLHPPAAEWPRASDYQQQTQLSMDRIVLGTGQQVMIQQVGIIPPGTQHVLNPQGTQSHQQQAPQMMVGRLPGGGGQISIHPVVYQQHTELRAVLGTGQHAMQQQIGFMPPASRHVSVVAGGTSTHAQRIQQQQSIQQQTTTQQDSSQQQLPSTYASTSGLYCDSAAGLPKTQVTSTLATDLSRKENIEYKTVRQHLSKLVANVQNPLTLALGLFSAGLIDQSLLNETTIGNTADQIKTTNLFTAVLSEVERDPGKFHVLLQALNEMSSMTQLVQSMKNVHAQGSISDSSNLSPPPAKQQKLDTGLQQSIHDSSIPDGNTSSSTTMPSSEENTHLPESKGEVTALDDKDLVILLNLLTKKVAMHWENIGLQLGFLASELKIIQRKPALQADGDPAFFREMLTHWLKWDHPPCHPPPTIEALANVLRMVGEQSVARHLRDNFLQEKVSHSVHEQKIGEIDVPAIKRPRLTTDLQQSLHNSPRASRLIATTTSGESSSMAHLPASNPIELYGGNLRDVYAKMQDIPEECWPPVKRTHYINLALLRNETANYDDEYTRHTIRGSFDDIYKDKVSIDFSLVFADTSPGSRILLEGRPGAGKSTLMRKITRDWSRRNILTGVTLLIFVQLRAFFNKKDISLEDIVHMVLPTSSVQQLVSQIEAGRGHGICLALDGLDEYSAASKKQNFIHMLIKGQVLPNAVVIVASRPAATQKFRQCVTKSIEVLGFLQPQVKEYVDSYYAQNPQRAEELLNYLSHHPNVLHMCYLPLHVAMVAFLFDKLRSSLPDTETEIYRQFTLQTLIRSLLKGAEQNSMDDEVGSVRLTDFSDMDDQYPEDAKRLSEICTLAFEATATSKQIFSHSEVSHLFKSERKEEESLGLITIDRHNFLSGPDATYSFLHLTFQEFLSAYYLVKLGEQELLPLVDRYGKKAHMQVVWKFFCGLSKVNEPVAMRVFEKLIELNPTEHLLLIDCAFESESLQACKLFFAKNGGKVQLEKERALNPSDLTAVGRVAVKYGSSLSEISLVSCKAGKEGLFALAQEFKRAENGVHATKFSFRGTHLDVEKAPAFCEVIGKLSSTTCMDLSCCGIGRATLSQVAGGLHSLKSLQSLNLEQNQLGPKSTALLMDLIDNLPNLSELRLSRNKNLDVKLLERPSLVKNLQKLSTDVNTIGSTGGLKQLISSISTLSFIRIDGTAVSLEVDIDCGQTASRLMLRDRGKEKLFCEHLEVSDTIEMVDMRLTGSDVQLLGEALKLCAALRTLSLVGADIGYGMAKVGEILRLCPSLQTLNIDAGVRCVAEFFNSSPLHETVSIWENGHTVAEIRRQLPSTPDSEICYCLERNAFSRWNDCRRTITHLLTDLPEFSKFRISIVESSLPAVSQSLDLDTISLEHAVWDAGIGERGAAVLGALLKHCPSLQSLNLPYNSIGDGGLEGLVQGLQYCTSLQTLDLGNNSITDGSADHLAQLGRALPSLKELYLFNNSIGDGGLEGLIQGLQYCTSLQKLNLGNNSITHGSADHLAQLGRALPSLKDLRSNSIEDRGLEGLLEGLQHCSSLQRLYLYENNISDDSVDQLAQFVRVLPSLKTLWIQGNKLSERGKDVIKQIEKERPDLSIVT